MKINGRDVTLTSEEITILKALRSLQLSSITYKDSETFIWLGNTINVRWLKGFGWIKNDETISVQMLLDMSKKTKTVWDLKEGDAFWYVNPLGSIDKSRWVNIDFDAKLRAQGNVFLTEEEAEFESKRREVVTKVKKYARPFKYGEKNLFPYWGYVQKRIGMIGVENTQEAHLYFESIEKIEQAIEEVGEEDFKKYYLGVTE